MPSPVRIIGPDEEHAPSQSLIEPGLRGFRPQAPPIAVRHALLDRRTRMTRRRAANLLADLIALPSPDCAIAFTTSWTTKQSKSMEAAFRQDFVVL